MAGLQEAMVALLRYTPDSVFFKRLVDGEFIFERVSDAKARKYRDSWEEIIGESDFSLFLKKEEAQKCHDDELRVMQTGDPIINQEEELTRLDGTTAWVSVTKFPWIDDESGEIIGIIGISRDITEKKKLERHLESVIARLSHDPQKNLFIIGGTIKSLLKGRRGAVINEAAGEMLAEANRLVTTTSNMLQEYLAESSQMISAGGLKRELLDLRNIFDSLFEEFYHEMTGKGVWVDYSMGAIPVGAVTFWAARDIKTVLRNLISNAIRHTYPDREIAYGFRRIEGGCLINVYNVGDEIPSEMREKIFDIGESGSGSSGMGLYLCREIVRGYGGEIWYEVTPDGNSNFVFFLPEEDNMKK